jgi:hypothetical protein
LHYKADTFASSYIENLGDGNFKMSTLPRFAQISNINDALVDDFNNDNHLDVLLVGNFFVSEIETTRNDAGKGLLLLGDGDGRFQPVSPFKSGVSAKGDAKNISYISVAGELKVLVANNNDKLQVFKIKNTNK